MMLIVFLLFIKKGKMLVDFFFFCFYDYEIIIIFKKNLGLLVFYFEFIYIFFELIYIFYLLKSLF